MYIRKRSHGRDNERKGKGLDVRVVRIFQTTASIQRATRLMILAPGLAPSPLLSSLMYSVLFSPSFALLVAVVVYSNLRTEADSFRSRSRGPARAQRKHQGKFEGKTPTEWNISRGRLWVWTFSGWSDDAPREHRRGNLHPLSDRPRAAAVTP